MLFDPMKPVLNIDGSKVVEDKQDVTLGVIAYTALLTPERDARGQSVEVSMDDQISRAKLAYRIHGSTLPVEITVEEAAMIKKLVAKRGQPLIMLQIAESIANPPVAKIANGKAEESHVTS